MLECLGLLLCLVPQARQVTEEGQDTQARQVTEVGQDTKVSKKKKKIRQVTKAERARHSSTPSN